MSFALVGSSYGDAYPTMGTTLSVSPTTIGNWFICTFFCSFPNTGAITGGGVTTWTLIQQDNGHAYSSQTWIGQITATGSQTITYSTSFLYLGTIVQEFSVLPPLTFDTSSIVDEGQSPAVSSGNFPSATTSGSNEMACGFTFVSGSSPTLSTSTSGYTYTPTYSHGMFGVFNTNVSGAQSPNWSSTAPVGGTFVTILLTGGSGMKIIGIT